MGNTPLLLAFVAIVVGGMGNIMRTLVAALAVGIVQSGVSFYWQPSAATWVSYAVVLLILAIRSKHDLLAHA
jgi:branched-chain amino acid transport system permease protein